MSNPSSNVSLRTHQEMARDDHVRPLKSEEIKHENLEEPNYASESGENFKQDIHLKLHRSTHGEEEPYHCSKCGISFRNSSTVKTHSCTKVEDGCSVTVVLEPNCSNEAEDPALISRPSYCAPSFIR